MKSGNKTILFSICLVIYLFSLPWSIEGQNKNTIGTSGDLDAAIELYNMGAYKNAVTEFNKIIKQNSGKKNATMEKAEGYKVLCTIALEQNNTTSSVNAFQKKYPTSSLLSRIKYTYGNFLISKKRFTEAIKAYNSVNTKQLSNSEKETLLLNKGYALIQTKRIDEAEQLFSEIIKSPQSTPANIQAAKYYKGYIAYSKEKFKEAIPLFEESSSDVRFSKLSQYYILDSKFMLKDYSYVTNNGSKIVDEIVKKDLVEQKDSLYNSKNREPIGKMARIVAEAYYQKNELKQASKYFSIYTDYIDEMSRQDRLLCGTLAYKIENWESAAKNLSMACTQDDSITQTASYTLADTYLKLKNKEQALAAFQRAAELEYDAKIKEDAEFNYAKLTFDLTGQSSMLEDYIKNNKVSQTKKDELYGYIATNAIQNKDYDYALSALNKIKNKNSTDNQNIQRANLLKGSSLLSAGSHHTAYSYLQKALVGNNGTLTNLANLLISECLYRDDKFKESLSILNSLKQNESFKNAKEYPMVFFNSGYNNFKMREFSNAESDFEEYLNLTGSGQNRLNPIAEEAKLRIADCRFQEKDYPIAIKMYKKIASAPVTDPREKELYPVLQMAIAYGLNGDIPDKIATLKHYTSAEYKLNKKYSEALYELSKAQIQNKDEGPAITTLIKLVYNPPDSLYFTQSLLDIAMINTNRENYDQAIIYCQKLLDYAPNTKEGEAALTLMENIYREKQTPEEFYKYLQEKGLSKDKTEEEKEAFFFNAAEQIYLLGKYESAINALTSYLEQFKDGANNTKALYYTAQSYKHLSNIKKAAQYFNRVMDKGYSTFFEDATLNYAEICYKNQQYQEAIESYKKIEGQVRSENTKMQILSGLVKSYYDSKDFDNAAAKANEMYINSLSNNMVKHKEEALYYKAKSLIALSDLEASTSVLQMAAANPNSEYGAEANYLLIRNCFNRGDFKGVENLVFSFSDTKTEQTYWLAKSFILLGDAYAERGAVKQALATYESVRDNYEGDDEILQIAKERIAELNK